MCASGVCESKCSTEIANDCPVLGIVEKLQVPVKEVVYGSAGRSTEILQGHAEGTAQNFFASGWTAR